MLREGSYDGRILPERVVPAGNDILEIDKEWNAGAGQGVDYVWCALNMCHHRMRRGASLDDPLYVAASAAKPPRLKPMNWRDSAKARIILRACERSDDHFDTALYERGDLMELTPLTASAVDRRCFGAEPQ